MNPSTSEPHQIVDMPQQPPSLAARPQFRGMPVPFTSLVLNGVPDFRVTDVDRWVQCITGKKCALCGDALPKLQWFVGGEKCRDHFAFFDPGMCLECAIYAMIVCPFLAMKKGYASDQIIERVQEKVGGAANLTVCETTSSEKPKTFFMFAASAFEPVTVNGGDIVLHIPAEHRQTTLKVPDNRQDKGVMDAFFAGVRRMDEQITRRL